MPPHSCSAKPSLASKPQELKVLLSSTTVTFSTVVVASNSEGERVRYIKKCAQSLQSVYAERLLLLRKLQDTDDPMSLHEIEHLRDLYEEDVKIHRELSEALEAGRVNLERRRAQEHQRLEDYYYDRYGFVFIDPETLNSSILPPPQGFPDSTTNSRTWDVHIANHDHEEMEKELARLRQRLDNLGKAPANKTELKEQLPPKKPLKSLRSKTNKSCSIV